MGSTQALILIDSQTWIGLAGCLHDERGYWYRGSFWHHDLGLHARDSSPRASVSGHQLTKNLWRVTHFKKLGFA